MLGTNGMSLRRATLLSTAALMAGTACSVAESPMPPSTADSTKLGHPAVTDPRGFSTTHPPEMLELSFRSADSKLNGFMYVAAGPGPHPTVVLLHGYPGNERNLDLAQAIRRAGANVLFFNYRGTWGSGGEFSLGNAIEDVAAAVAMVRTPASAQRYRADPARVALVGHSFGGFLAAVGTAADSTIACMGFLAGADFGPWGRQGGANDEVRQLLEQGLGRDIDREGGPVRAETPAVVQDLIDNVAAYDIVARTAALADRPLLLVAGTRDNAAVKAEHHDPVVAALRAAGAARLTELVYDDDHYFSANRIALAEELIDWLRQQCWSGV